MGELTKKDLQDVVREAFNERSAIGGEQHHVDHEFIQMLKVREERRIARIEKFKMSLIGGTAMALVSGLIWVGALIWDYGHHTPPH